MSFQPHCSKCGHIPPRSDFIFCGQCGSQLVRQGPPLVPVVVGVGAGRVIAVPASVVAPVPPSLPTISRGKPAKKTVGAEREAPAPPQPDAAAFAEKPPPATPQAATPPKKDK